MIIEGVFCWLKNKTALKTEIKVHWNYAFRNRHERRNLNKITEISILIGFYEADR